MKNVPVKIGWEILIIVYGIFILIVLQHFSAPKAAGLVAAVLYFIFVTVCIFGIRYKIRDEILEITNGFFGKTKIDISKIHTIEKTWNPLSSPAPSLFGRVEIYYENRSIVIAPKDFSSFKEELLRINPAITVKS